MTVDGKVLDAYLLLTRSTEQLRHFLHYVRNEAVQATLLERELCNKASGSPLAVYMWQLRFKVLAEINTGDPAGLESMIRAAQVIVAVNRVLKDDIPKLIDEVIRALETCFEADSQPGGVRWSEVR